MGNGNNGLAAQKNLEERIESEKVAVLLIELVKITKTEENPRLLFKNVAREIGYDELSISSAYKEHSLTMPKRVYDYLARLKKRINENNTKIVVDRNCKRLVIDFGEFEKKYNAVLGNYRIGEGRLNFILNKRFKAKPKEIERYLASNIIKSKRMEGVYGFLAVLGNRERMEYDPSKRYCKGDYLCLNNLGLGEVVDVDGENMQVDFSGKGVELKCGFMQGEGRRTSNFTIPVYESNIL